MPTGPELTLDQVRQTALRTAKLNGDAHPVSVYVASGPLRKASRVMDPSGSLYPDPTPQQEAELNSPYYLVVIRGRFPLAYAVHSHPPARIGGRHQSRGTPAVPRVLELLLSAHPGYGVSGFSYGPNPPAPLRLLGPVTRLV